MKACGVSGADRDVVLLELPDPPSPGVSAQVIPQALAQVIPQGVVLMS